MKDNQTKGILITIVAFILVMFFSFLICKNQILENLVKTDFCNIVFGKEPKIVSNYRVKMAKEKGNDDSIVFTYTDETSAENSEQKEILSSLEEDKNAVPINPLAEADTESQKQEEIAVAEKKLEEKDLVVEVSKKKASEAPLPSVNSSRIVLYFIQIEENGRVTRKEVYREIPRTTTPLTSALQNLLSGTNFEELNKNYMSMIPEGTQLISASIKNKVAYLNFSEEFLYNKYGVEGYLAQLMQIVYTATAFSSIDSVQFLINGEKIDFLGTEGVWVGSPITRNFFN